jgi:hypothetical protein
MMTRLSFSWTKRNKVVFSSFYLHFLEGNVSKWVQNFILILLYLMIVSRFLDFLSCFSSEKKETLCNDYRQWSLLTATFLSEKSLPASKLSVCLSCEGSDELPEKDTCLDALSSSLLLQKSHRFQTKRRLNTKVTDNESIFFLQQNRVRVPFVTDSDSRKTFLVL